MGASANSHLVYQTVRVNAPGNPRNLRGLTGDGPKINSPLTAPARDVTATGDNGLACAALPAGSLTGAWALIQRGTCYYSDKINFAQAAGAIGAIIYQSDGIDDITARMYVQNTGIPAVLIGNTDGKALKTILGNPPSATVTVDPAYATADNAQVNSVASYSGRGPSVGNYAATRDFALKPETVAPGTNIYTATQKFDPNSDTYNATGYTTVNGTSYAVPFVAGVAAMALAKNPNLKQQDSSARLKSVVVNTASTDLQGDIHVTDAGAGKLNAADAVNAAVTLGSGGDLIRSDTHTARQSQPDSHQCEQRERDAFHQRAATHQRCQRARDGKPEQRNLDGWPEPADYRFPYREQTGGGRVRRIRGR